MVRRLETIIVIDRGRIVELGPAADARVPEGADVRDLSGRTLLPGLVMLHEHLVYGGGRDSCNSMRNRSARHGSFSLSA
jgi:imidazolonepropionase-like amidohydrolase